MTSPNGHETRHVDLDAARVARWEAFGVEATVVHGGKEWRMVPELPLQFAVATLREDVEGMIGLLLVDPSEAPEFLRTHFTLADLRLLLADVYGVKVGEAPASARSSRNGGKRSRQTSKASTGST